MPACRSVSTRRCCCTLHACCLVDGWVRADIIEIITEGKLRSEGGVQITMQGVLKIVRALSEALAEVRTTGTVWLWWRPSCVCLGLDASPVYVGFTGLVCVDGGAEVVVLGAAAHD